MGATEAGQILRRITSISAIVKHFYPEMAPFDYQGDYLDDFLVRFWVWKKARQIGFSQTTAFKGLVKALAVPGYLKIFISMSLDDAKEKITYANALYERIAEHAPVPEKTVDNRMELNFSNGSRILCLFTPRGKAQADLDLDEFAHYQQPRRIWQAALPIMIHPGSRLSVASTPLHSFTMFHTIFEGEGGKFQEFKRRKVHWWDCPIHCVDVDTARRQILDSGGERVLDTEMAVRMFGTPTLKQLYDTMLDEDFRQEFELHEMDDETSLLPWQLILNSTPTGERAVARYHTLEELKEHTKGGLLFAGYDVGRYNDAGELTVFEERDGDVTERYFETFLEQTFEVQEAAVDALMSLPNVERLAIDRTGMGEQLAERLERRWGHRIVPVHFTGGTGGMRNTLCTTIKFYMERGKVKFYPDRSRNYQMHSVKKQVTASGGVGYVVARGKQDATGHKHHADAFWSRALGLWAHADLRALGRPRVRFIAA